MPQEHDDVDDAAKRACSSSDSPNFRCVASPAMTRTLENLKFSESAFSSSRARAVPALVSRTRQNNTASGAIRKRISRNFDRGARWRQSGRPPRPSQRWNRFSTAPASSRLRHFQTLPDVSKPPRVPHPDPNLVRASRAASANIPAVVRAPPVPSDGDLFIATFAGSAPGGIRRDDVR